MALYHTLFISFLLGNVLSTLGTEETNSTILERLRQRGTHHKRLVFEDFTRNVFTVPGYVAKESKEASDPPFQPNPECGDQFVNLTEGSFGTIISPNYPDRYSSDLQCEWTIESIPGTVVEATFFDVVTQPWLFSFYDFVLVSSDEKFENYRRFAGDTNSKMPFTFISDENRLGIRLVTSRWLNFRGFKMSYVVRPVRASDKSPPHNEYGSVLINDLTAVCSSKPIDSQRENNKFNQHAASSESSTRIVNGLVTLPHQYPFMVAILSDDSSFCGGSLIDQNHVITAAHCVDRSEKIDLFFGVYNMSNRAESLYARQVRSIQYSDIPNHVFINPNYDRHSGAHDIAVLRVNKVKITKYVQPIFLPSVYSASNSFSGWTLKTLGWGSSEADEEKLKLSPVLRVADAAVIPTVQCREFYHGAVTGNNICTQTEYVKPTTTEQSVESTTPLTEITTEQSVDESTPLTEITTEQSVDESTPLTETTPLPSTTAPEYAPESEDDTAGSAENVEYQSPCHGDSGAPLFADYAENVNDFSGTEEGLNLNKAGPSNHECVNAKPNGSGGSLVKQAKDTACQRPKDTNARWYVQVGVLSFGARSCAKETPVAFTRITAYLQWIAYITGRHG